MISMLLGLCGLVLMGGGFVALAILFIILAVMYHLISMNKARDNVYKKLAQSQIECEEIPQIKNYRYHLINIKTKQVVAMSDDYLAICKKKRTLGNGIMIKDNQYVKKQMIL